MAGTKTNLQCAPGRNGGETDTGVSASKIRLATTAVLDGQAKSLLEHSPIAMKAVIDKVNRAGGICGRLLSLEVRNDSFDAATGLRYLTNFIDEGYFAGASPTGPEGRALFPGLSVEENLRFGWLPKRKDRGSYDSPWRRYSSTSRG